jgi:hypothetical protein
LVSIYEIGYKEAFAAHLLARACKEEEKKER